MPILLDRIYCHLLDVWCIFFCVCCMFWHLYIWTHSWQWTIWYNIMYMQYRSQHMKKDTPKMTWNSLALNLKPKFNMNYSQVTLISEAICYNHVIKSNMFDRRHTSYSFHVLCHSGYNLVNISYQGVYLRYLLAVWVRSCRNWPTMIHISCKHKYTDNLIGAI